MPGDSRACSQGILNLRFGFPSFFLQKRRATLTSSSLEASRTRILRYLFDDCVLDTSRRELRRGAAPVAVEPQVFDLLVHLVRHRDRVVSKDELLATVWHGRIVSEFALFNRINAARSAIGDSGNRQRLIKTLPRKGLRFVGDVCEGKPAAATGTQVGPPASPSLALPDRPSIAVLPFANMSGDPDQDYFADGISEDLITGLARIRWLFVIARNSSFIYKGRAVDVSQVARELGVRYVLEGSVRRSGKKAAHQCAAGGRDHRGALLGRTIRQGAGRHLHRAG